MAIDDPHGGLIMVSTGVPVNIKATAHNKILGKDYYIHSNGQVNYIYAWRENKYNDKTLHLTVYAVDENYNQKSGIMAGASLSTPGLAADWGGDNYSVKSFIYYAYVQEFNYTNLFKISVSDGRKMMNFGQSGHLTYYFSPDGPDKHLTTINNLTKENLDLPHDPSNDNCVNNMNLTIKQHINSKIGDKGALGGMDGLTGIKWETNTTADKNITIQFPPYRPFPDNSGGKPKLPDPKPIGSSTGGPDISNTTLTLEAKSKYKISKVGLNQQVEWNPTTTVGSYNEPITNKAVIQNVGEFSTSPASFNTPSPEASTYTAYVERYYTNYSEVMARSNTLTLFTYSKPSLSSITLGKTTISPRAGETLRVSLYNMNNRTHSIENKFRTCIWSPYKNPYYDEENESSFKDLTSDGIKIMFPDSKASNGEINSQVKVKRKNLGISGGNPGNGSLVYETEVRTKNLKIQYKPTVPVNPNVEPNPNNPSNSGIAYYKKEDNKEGAKLTAGHTWVLPNTYDISRMNGINVRLQYPKTDTSGVLSGYRIRLYSSNDGSPDSNVKYFEDHWNTTNYIDTYFVSYDTLRRGISGNEIEITPYYISSSGERWYGPTMRKKFVDIAWTLNKPVIDCPLTGTTWHNHKYRILFKLPVDRDTNYKGKNDIELHYGSGKYRYQEIQININGTITTFADNGFYNAHNSWISPVNVSNANLTYLRTIIVNPALIGTYSDKNQYIISIRIRKAYGQNPNWDGWSEWSDTITVNRKTVKNDVVNRHEYINASHYMTVQTAFNLSTACYAKKASDNSNFVVKESFDRQRGDNINGPHLSPPENQPFQTIREYLSEFKDLHQLKDKINSYATFDTDKNRNPVKLDYQNNLLASFTPIQEFITASKDQNGATECDNPSTILKGRNYMKYMCDEINHLY